MRKSPTPRLATAVLALGAFTVSPALAVEEFEIEEAGVEKGKVELYYQGDQHFGFPRRGFIVTDTDPDNFEFSVDDNEVPKHRDYLEFGMGLTDWVSISVAAEFSKERVDDPKLLEDREVFRGIKFSGYEGELKLVLVPRNGDGFGITWFTEIGTSEPSSTVGSTVGIGPIVEFAKGPFSATFNPVFVKHFSGENVEMVNEDGATVIVERADNRWDFNYGWQVAYQMSSALTLTVEGFGSVERLGSTGWAAHTVEDERLAIEAAGGSVEKLLGDHDQHYAGPIVYYKLDTGGGTMAVKDDGAKDGGDDEGSSVTLGFGVLFGLNDNSNDVALKWSIESEF